MKIETHIQSSKGVLLTHPLYNEVNSIHDLRIFASVHVFAVWDFMSLLKRLQQKLTCTSVPWMPFGSASTRYLINEIVTCEESDLDETGNRISHFELYIKAMKQMGSSTDYIDSFLDEIKCGGSVLEIIDYAPIPPAIKDFLEYTFTVTSRGKTHEIAAVFTYGREDLIPDMFIELVKRLDNERPETVSIFKYYLERHIEVDGDYHSKLAKQMVRELCGTDTQKWEEAMAAAKQAIRSRILLWNYISGQITASRN